MSLADGTLTDDNPFSLGDTDLGPVPSNLSLPDNTGELTLPDLSLPTSTDSTALSGTLSDVSNVFNTLGTVWKNIGGIFNPTGTASNPFGVNVSPGALNIGSGIGLILLVVLLVIILH